MMATRTRKDTVRINVFISKADREYLRRYADKEGGNISFTVRRLVKEFIARGERND